MKFPFLSRPINRYAALAIIALIGTVITLAFLRAIPAFVFFSTYSG